MVSLGGRSVGKWLVVVLAAMGAVTGYVLSGVSPVYRSEARIQVVPPRIPADIVRMPVSEPVQDRLQKITQMVLSRTRLEGLIRDFNLYERERRSGAIMQDIVEEMRRHISVAVDPKGENPSGFVVGFTSNDRRAAQQVTEKLAGFFIDESLKDGARRAENTSDFVESQIEESARRLTAIDTQLTRARAAGSSDLSRMQVEAEVIRNTYKTLLEKREQALMRLNMERRQIGEQFVLIDQARVAERPEGPTRRQASIAGALAGVALALVVNLFLGIRRALAARATVVAQA